METQIRRIGNSTGTIIPISILRKLRLKEGDSLKVEEKNGSIILNPAKIKYKLEELLAKCDLSAPMPNDLAEWESNEAVGNEKW